MTDNIELYRMIRDVARATGYVTNNQACEVAEAVANALTQARPVDEPTDAALKDAATSLETISRLAGRKHYDADGERIETCMGTFEEVRYYAKSRAGVARAAMRATPAGGVEG